MNRGFLGAIGVAILIVAAIIGWRMFGGQATEMLEDAGNAVSDVAADVVDAAGDATNAVVDGAQDAAAAGADMASSAVDATVDAAGTVADVAGDAANAVVDGAQDAAGAVANTVESAVDATGDMVNNTVDAVTADAADAESSLTSDVAAMLPEGFDISAFADMDISAVTNLVNEQIGSGILPEGSLNAILQHLGLN